MDLLGRNIVVYDLEIKNSISQCSNGWASHDEMGISVGCAFDYRDGKYRVFMDDNITELVERLNEPETLIVAFNHISFDNKLLRGQGHPLKPDAELLNYDMLVVSRKGAGVNQFAKGFRLDDHLKACCLPMKTGDGAMAPIWWQEGKIGKVVDYCLNDVTQERALFEYMVTYGRLSSSTAQNFTIEIPSSLKEDFALSRSYDLDDAIRNIGSDCSRE